MNAKEKIEAVIAEVEGSTDFEIIAEMKAALNSIYGEERNQITKPSYESIIKRAEDFGVDSVMKNKIELLPLERVADYLKGGISEALSYQIIIHFPEITIRNDSRQHVIKNIYVRLFLRSNGTIATCIQGMRTTLTEIEFLSRYLHSHLVRLVPDKITFNNFCTGVGEINQLLAILNTKYTSANFMMLLMHVKNFLEWESLEGHPHMLISDIFKRGTTVSYYGGLSADRIALAAEIILGDMRKGLTVPEIMKLFNFDVTERGIKVSPTIGLEKWMANRIKKWNIRATFGNSFTTERLLSLKDSAGTYFSVLGATPEICYQEGTVLNFKGRDIRFEVIDRSQTQTQIHETVADPKITEGTCKKLSRILTKAALTTPGIKSGDSLIYNAQFTEPDKVPVQGDMDRGVVGDALLSN